MATVNPAGMGHKTSRQFRRVADDIRKYANSVYEYKEANPGDDQWYDSHGTGRNSGEKYIGKFYPLQVPAVNPKQVAKRSPITAGRRDRSKSSR